MSQNVITAAAMEAVVSDLTPVVPVPKPAKKAVVKVKGFATLSVPELQEVAENFGVEYPDGANKPMLIGALSEEGVTFEQYAMFRDATKQDPKDLLDDEEEVEPREDFVEAPLKSNAKRAARATDILVKMDRANYRFEIMGKVFTKEHPFVVMSPEDAQDIFDRADGFRMATPREASEYYS